MKNVRTLPTRASRFASNAEACALEINAVMDRLSVRYGAHEACAGLTSITGVMLSKFRQLQRRQELADTWKHLRRAARMEMQK